MAKRSSRTRPCDRHDAAQRYDQARAFGELAELDPESTDGPTRSAAVSNAVLAGIAAADSICCQRLGRHAAGDDHQQALALIEEAGEVGREARHHLETLLSIKHKAQYEEVDPTVTEAKRAIRAMRSILELVSRA
ncbi:MAG: hypothetical protein WD895_04975 [Acidimicrobiia bacterium]